MKKRLSNRNAFHLSSVSHATSAKMPPVDEDMPYIKARPQQASVRLPVSSGAGLPPSRAIVEDITGTRSFRVQKYIGCFGHLPASRFPDFHLEHDISEPFIPILYRQMMRVTKTRRPLGPHPAAPILTLFGKNTKSNWPRKRNGRRMG